MLASRHSTLALLAASVLSIPGIALAQRDSTPPGKITRRDRSIDRTTDRADERDTPRDDERETDPSDSVVPFPHPLITEVLFAVPTGDHDGDTDLSGVRSATGDEFIELMNPHDRPINLKGYRLVDGQPVSGPGSRDSRASGGGGNKTQQEKDPRRGMGAKKSVGPEDMPYSKPKQKSSEPPVKNPSTSVRGRTTDRSRLDFTFPELVLHPGEVVVVFNGYKSTPAGSDEGLVGTAKKAADKNGSFNGAFVFTMQCTSMYQALSNREDMIVLLASDGKPVDVIRWGPTQDDGTPAPKDKRSPVRSRAGVEEWVPANCIGSVQRTSIAGEFACHADLNAELYSPGMFTPMQVRETTARAQPEDAEDEMTEDDSRQGDDKDQPAEQSREQPESEAPAPKDER